MKSGVLGIGFIMEEVGKGARLVFRYPASPPPFFLPISAVNHNGMSETIEENNEKSLNTSPNKKSDHNNTTTKSSDSINGSKNGSIDLFFDLNARVFSKLFRPKRSLCGQPLTVNVSGTTFCCRAELFESQPSTIGEGSNHPLVLFCVVVALAPFASATETQPPHSMQQPHYSTSVHSASVEQSDDTFSTTQCVHRNLARLCRVLKREELRCRYVSRQCNMLLQIRKEYEATVGHENNCFTSGHDGAAVGTTNSPTIGLDINPKIVDNASGPTSLSSNLPPLTSTNTNCVQESKNSNVGISDNTPSRPEMTRAQRREHEQNLIEIMLAASPPNNSHPNADDFGGQYQHGNLARELASVFHLLSSPSSSPLPNATSHEGVVYINRHIAVPLDSVNINFVAPWNSTMNHNTKHHPCIEPYHTLLFPTSSPSEVLESLADETMGGNLMTTSSSIAQCLLRLLPHVQPHKSIHETAWEAALALPHVMNAASWLVHVGLCVAVLPVLRKNRYVCAGGVVSKMATMALPFWQTFGARSRNCVFFWGDSTSGRIPQNDYTDDDGRHRKSMRTVTAGAPHLFFLVSALTTKMDDKSYTEPRGITSSSPTLGDAIRSISGYNESATQHIRGDSSQHGENRQQIASTFKAYDCAKTEEIIYSMAVWLIANKIIVQAHDYLVAGEVKENETSSEEESLYEELFQNGYLDGIKPISSASYELGIDEMRFEKFLTWGQSTGRLNVVSRP